MVDMIKEDVFNVIPITREERIKRLSEAVQTLKTEFVGLDTIIDEISESISSWYITPEIISRPVVISLWGMTGTGKSSVVRRLTQLLGLKNSTMFFDCGEYIADSKDISTNICETFGFDTDDYSGSDNGMCTLDYPVFVFDEFQYARTINDEGSEDVKSSIRPIWTLIDSGVLDVNDSYNWSYNQLVQFVEDLGSFVEMYPDIPVEKNEIKDPGNVELTLNSLGLLHYDRALPLSPASHKDEDDEEDDPFRPLKFIDSDKIKTIVRRLNKLETGLGMKVAQELTQTDLTTGQIYERLVEVKNSITRPKTINCQNALIFVVGNLDEAFDVAGDQNPDMDADMFYDITSRVTISDIKKALKQRFRPEQIARLGNNLIKYPTLTKESFQEIIKNEVARMLVEYKKVTGIEVTLAPNMYDLIYEEGVFPTQGVRPIFTTIGSILTPYLSKILMVSEGKVKEAEISVASDNFHIAKTQILIHLADKEFSYDHTLQLGAIRDPKSRKKRYCCSVHEAGHAVAYAALTGKAPDLIVAVSTDHGGFCTTYDKETQGEIDSRFDVDLNVKVDLAGYLAEHLFFDPKLCLMGAGSDLEEAWNTLSDAVQQIGYFEPVLFSNFMTETNTSISTGLSIRRECVSYGGRKVPVEDAMSLRFQDLTKETRELLEANKELIRRLALYLGEAGSMDSTKFMEFVADDHGGTLTPDEMEKIKETNSPEYYKSILEGK